ncbi:MAG: hypothetical protein LUP94_03840 [Candidatus Methanomethylicus sp.]|nr:hypothetical protein [Candidatus Methanomethylicus sp.]
MKREEISKFLDPTKAFSEGVAFIEEFDPLTGAVCRINATRAARPKQQLGKTVETPVAKCSFCQPYIDTSTPKFPKDFCLDGRIKHGGAILFPNLFPLTDLHGVCVFTPQHKLDLNLFDAGEISDGLFASIEFLKAGREAGAPHHLLGWNQG